MLSRAKEWFNVNTAVDQDQHLVAGQAAEKGRAAAQVGPLDEQADLLLESFGGGGRRLLSKSILADDGAELRNVKEAPLRAGGGGHGLLREGLVEEAIQGGGCSRGSRSRGRGDDDLRQFLLLRIEQRIPLAPPW